MCSTNRRLSMTSISNASSVSLVIVASGVMYIAHVSRSPAFVGENPRARWGIQLVLDELPRRRDWLTISRASGWLTLCSAAVSPLSDGPLLRISRTL
jgi:hypothetical protein